MAKVTAKKFWIVFVAWGARSVCDADSHRPCVKREVVESNDVYSDIDEEEKSRKDDGEEKEKRCGSV